MKIGLLANTLEPVHGLSAGTHLHFLEVAKRLVDDEVIVFGPPFAREEVLERLPAARYVVMPSLDAAIDVRRRHYPAFLARVLLSPAALRELRRCDVLLATSHFMQDTIPAALALGRRSALTLWHTMQPPWRRGGARIEALTYYSERFSIAVARRLMGGVIGGSEFVLRQHGFDRSGLQRAVTLNGVEHMFIANGGPASPAQGCDVVFVGRLSAAKGIDDLLQAWPAVVAAYPAATLRIVGDGEPAYRDAVRRQVAQHPLLARSVVFVGRVTEAQKLAELRAARVFVSPSKEEGWGIAVAEALAVGLPCVTYDLPVYREAFPAGRVAVAVGNVPALAAALLALVRDEPMRARLARAGHESVRDFTWEHAAAVERDLLLRLVEQPAQERLPARW